MEDAFGREVVAPGSSRAYAGVWWVVATALGADSVVRGSWPSAGYAVLGLLLTMVLAYAYWWRPGLVADDEAIALQNPLRDVRVPWPQVVAVGGRWHLDVRTPEGRYTAYVAGPQRRPRRSRRGDDIPSVPTSGLAERLSERWERRRVKAPDGPVQVRWAWEVLAPLLALAAALVATVSLT